MLASCRRVEEYEKLNRISEGTYGVVYRARERTTGRICALKMVRMEKEKEGFPLTSIREINILLSFHHPNIVDVSEVVVGSKLDDIFMVMEYMEHDLKALQDSMSKPFTVSEVKCLMRQLFAGIAYLHDNWVLHRDLKTSNILYSNRGELKICDFGLARQFGSPLRPYTHNVVTLHYRAPELLLGTEMYSTPIDMWSLGCIMAELLTKETLFVGESKNGSEIAQIKKIFDIVGTPSEDNWPGHKQLKNMDKFNFMTQPRNRLRERFPLPGTTHDGRNPLSAEGFALLNGLLQLDPSRRPTAEEALNHPWFSEQPLPKERALMPTYPEKGPGSLPKHKSQPQLRPSPDDPVLRAAELARLFSKK
ncbi:Pkinase-domain-containing protein [Coccomyxa subellipsoidea C-169]|uniref:Pkinase-domain-containing protein n=1 Tax=Coccomyxa subellipsoidea (strain C-169) TaxID=574566 RepID=I0YNJ5_COCSC|nr:Pkinase-domain-containing protein [Coccomyxa subellipsoidea C-169]EIE19964.1 Pkinase-domain-containing protein [Coccomyxa subellipsoidea C-169]|eukprot:XP_005644508.1 Pkinase-domain-containing protein [Coccomyxa subellipsoidea C-169]